ncbi:MAG: antibiotic biosynthesis monooxygenase family protein [Caulobacteraceae bacterium]
MSTISADDGVMTLINTFDVEPDDADRLIAVLVEATEKVMRHRGGFVSANIHKSEDGSKVVNYAQWATRGDFEAMRADPEARAHMNQCAEIAKSFDPMICEVVFAEGHA